MKIEHIAVYTLDLEKLKTFYETYFGAVSNDKYINDKKGFSSYFLSFGDGARLEIMQQESVPRSGNDPHQQFTGFIHIAFQLESEKAVDELTQRLVDEGYEKIAGPRRTGDGYYESCILDPDNNRIEITA